MTDKPKTPRFVLDLNEERRALLEDYRARNGLRSLAGAVHRLIDGTKPVPIQVLDVDAEHQLPGPQKPAADRVSVGSLVSLPKGAKLKG